VCHKKYVGSAAIQIASLRRELAHSVEDESSANGGSGFINI